MKPRRNDLEDLAMQHLQPGVELSRQQLRVLLNVDGGDLSRLMERLVRRELVAVRRDKPHGWPGRAPCFYRRFDGVEYTPVMKVAPLPKVLARMERKAEPMPPIRRICTVFDLGAT